MLGTYLCAIPLVSADREQRIAGLSSRKLLYFSSDTALTIDTSCRNGRVYGIRHM